MKCVSFLYVFIPYVLSVSGALAGGRAWESALTHAPAGPYKTKKKCKLDYVMSWNGAVNSGACSVEFERNSGRAKTREVKCTGQTTGIVRRVFPYECQITTKYRGDTLKPVSYHIWERTKEETKALNGYFKNGGVKTKDVTVPLESQKESVRTSAFQYPQLFDLYTAVLHIGSQSLANGERHDIVLYPFDRPYLARVKVLGRESHLGHECIKLDLKLSKIRKDLSLKHYDKMKSATMWISDNPDRVMVELRSEIFIGDVRVTLKNSHWD